MKKLTRKTLNKAVKLDNFYKDCEVELQTIDQQAWAMMYRNNGSWTRGDYKYKFDDKYFPNLNEVYAYIFREDYKG